MTNDQQAYDRAMAHNAMLREAIREVWLNTAPCVQGMYKKRELEALIRRINKILTPIHGATEADADAWEKKLRQEVMQAVHPLQPEYEKLQQQLATVTNERDALRVKLEKSKKNEADILRRYQNLFSRVNSLAKADT